ncbi:uncharacterized protein BJ171DRAFT_578747 [Polychytrium aggregatum]|uniref:uncharacterized protein n=1 Tax=Polychytrium aggregatum TaxID=110093 RepID=UPI0022FE0DAF|nr:uncharacterized protein BJ171DRAFT_578747 [Polychytrium aggregatum]KAI9207634.1 hypothetical protein BJ171DRAFT_578747 [Polychytrium aggregatum]
MYTSCTQVANGTFAITINNPTSGQIEFYACADAGCNTCQIVGRDTPSNACTIDGADSGTGFVVYRVIGVLSDPTVALPSGFPNGTRASSTAPSAPSATPTPTNTQSNVNVVLISGIAAGAVVFVALVAGLLVWLSRRSKRARKSQYQAEPVESIYPPSFVVNAAPSVAPIAPIAPSAVPIAASAAPVQYSPQYISPEVLPQSTIQLYPASYPTSPQYSYASSVPDVVPVQPLYNTGSPPNYRESVSSSRSEAVHVDDKFQIGSFQRIQDPAQFGGPSQPFESSSSPSSHNPSVGRQSSQNAPKYVAVEHVSKFNPKDLPLNIGDVIVIEHDFENGHAQGFNQTTGLSGVISLSSVRPLGQERYLPALPDSAHHA